MSQEEQVMSKIAEVLEVDPAMITPETTAADIESWDSMGTMGILFALSNNFGITLQPHETSKLQSVRSILELIKSAGPSS